MSSFSAHQVLICQVLLRTAVCFFLSFFQFWSQIVSFSSFLSSGADNAIRGRDEWSHWPPRDNPVALHSYWLKGKTQKKTVGYHYLWAANHCLETFIFYHDSRKNTQKHFCILCCVLMFSFQCFNSVYLKHAQEKYSPSGPFFLAFYFVK